MELIRGICNGSSGQKYDIWIEYNIVSQDSKELSTNIEVDSFLKRNDGYSNSAFNFNNCYREIKYDDSNVISSASPIDTRNGAVVHLQHAAYKIKHDEKGKKKITLSASFSINTTGLSNGSVSAILELPTIKVYPKITALTIDEVTSKTCKFSYTFETISSSIKSQKYRLNAGQYINCTSPFLIENLKSNTDYELELLIEASNDLSITAKINFKTLDNKGNIYLKKDDKIYQSKIYMLSNNKMLLIENLYLKSQNFLKESVR